MSGSAHFYARVCLGAVSLALIAMQPAAFADSEELTARRTINNYLINRSKEIVGKSENLADRLRDKSTEISLNGDADSQEGEINVKGELRGEDAKLSQIFDLGQADRVNVWFNGKFSRNDSLRTGRNKSVMDFGLDYRRSKDLVLGVSGQYDELAEANHGTQVSDKARIGWFAGPYLVTRLHENLIFDGRASIGRSVNELGLVQENDRLETERVLVKGQFSGDFALQGWKVTPAVSVVYFEENEDVYIAGAEVSDFGEAVSFGRVAFGPRFTRTFEFGSDREITPVLNVQGSWDFDQTSYTDLHSGALTKANELRAKVEGQLLAKVSEDRRFTLNTFYDGIGVSNFNTFGMTVGMTVSLE
ncbi:MAG: hypothetical protein CMK07_14680 [Ponticaulis sp.]|nr:hypothetical protein [Ponticaulis sp.]